MLDEGINIDDIASQINNQLDETDDVLSAELHSIVNHRYLSGIMELQVKYTNEELSMHPMESIKDE